MSGVVPTAPEKPADEMEDQIKSPDTLPADPPDYNSHFVQGPPGPAVPPPVGYPGGFPVRYYSLQQPGTFPNCKPTGGTYPIQYQPGKYPVSYQSAPITWMPGPAPLPDCPPGLEYLTQECFEFKKMKKETKQVWSQTNLVFNSSSTPPLLYNLNKLDNIHVLQHFEPLESMHNSVVLSVFGPVMMSFETNNKYDIKNNLDQMVYIVTEDTDDFTRNAYRTLRPFVLRVTDFTGREIMTVQRPFRCTCCCFCCPSTRQELEVQCPPGVTLGFVLDHWNLCRAVYSVQNEKKETVMRIRGPCSTYGCGADSVFEVTSLDGVSNIGSIIRKWNGLMSAMGDADHFDIRFPLDLDVKMKAMIFGACFLIDFMYFERSPPQRSSR